MRKITVFLWSALAGSGAVRHCDAGAKEAGTVLNRKMGPLGPRAPKLHWNYRQVKLPGLVVTIEGWLGSSRKYSQLSNPDFSLRRTDNRETLETKDPSQLRWLSSTLVSRVLRMTIKLYFNASKLYLASLQNSSKAIIRGLKKDINCGQSSLLNTFTGEISL